MQVGCGEGARAGGEAVELPVDTGKEFASEDGGWWCGVVEEVLG